LDFEKETLRTPRMQTTVTTPRPAFPRNRDRSPEITNATDPEFVAESPQKRQTPRMAVSVRAARKDTRDSKDSIPETPEKNQEYRRLATQLSMDAARRWATGVQEMNLDDCFRDGLMVHDNFHDWCAIDGYAGEESRVKRLFRLTEKLSNEMNAAAIKGEEMYQYSKTLK
jgi:hypothetical protein